MSVSIEVGVADQPIFNPSEVDHAVVFANKYASNADRAMRDIRDSGLPYYVVLMSRNAKENKRTILSQDYNNAVLVGVGGDGTHHTAGNILMSDAAMDAGLTTLPYIAMRGGNANDFATMLTGRDRFKDIIRHGRPLDIRPIDTRIGEGPSRYALGYFSVGGTAEAARRLDVLKQTRLHQAIKKLPILPLALEGVVTLQTINDHTPFTITSGDGHDKLEESKTELILVRGHRMGKIAKSHAQLDTPLMERIVLRSDGNPVRTLAIMTGMALRATQANMYHKTDTVCLHSKDNRPLSLQYDGEFTTAPSGSEIHAGIAKTGFTVLTTR